MRDGASPSVNRGVGFDGNKRSLPERERCFPRLNEIGALVTERLLNQLSHMDVGFWVKISHPLWFVRWFQRDPVRSGIDRQLAAQSN